MQTISVFPSSRTAFELLPHWSLTQIVLLTGHRWTIVNSSDSTMYCYYRTQVNYCPKSWQYCIITGYRQTIVHSSNSTLYCYYRSGKLLSTVLTIPSINITGHRWIIVHSPDNTMYCYYRLQVNYRPQFCPYPVLLLQVAGELLSTVLTVPCIVNTGHQWIIVHSSDNTLFCCYRTQVNYCCTGTITITLSDLNYDGKPCQKNSNSSLIIECFATHPPPPLYLVWKCCLVHFKTW